MSASIGHLAALGTAVCWTLSTISFTGAARRAGSLSVNIIRLLIAWCLFAGYGLLSPRGLALPVDATGEAWLWLSVSGFIGFFLGDLCYFRAFLVIGPRLATLFLSLAPPLTAACGFLVLGETLRPTQWAGMAVTLAGVSWVVLERRSNGNGELRRPSLWGMALGILAAAGQGIGAVFSKLGMGPPPGYDPFAASQIRVQVGIACFVVLLFIIGWYPRVFEALRDPRAMLGTFVGSFLGPFLGVGLFLFSLQNVEAGVAQTIVSLLPVLILPFVIYLDREKVTRRAVAGACIAVAGVGILSL